MSFIDIYGLVISRAKGETEENSLLWTAQNIILTEKANEDSEPRTAAFRRAVNRCRISEGVYNQNPKYSEYEPENPHDKYMSHDQLTAICSMSYKHGVYHHVDIWNEIKRQKFRYDNVNPEAPNWSRLLHPRDIIYIGLLNNSLICRALKPVLDLMILVTFLTHYKVRPIWYHRLWAYLTTRNRVPVAKYVKTDGELLSYVRFNCYDMGLIAKICNWLITKRFGSWTKVFSTYFKVEYHINNVLAKRVDE